MQVRVMLVREGRKVLVLCDMESLTYAEAAGSLGIPIGTVRSRLSRARKEFKKAWK